VALRSRDHGTGEQGERAGDRHRKKLTPQRRFLFRLALALGKTVGELEQTMSGVEMQEWMAFAVKEPFGEMRADIRAGIVAAAVASSKGRRVSPTDFMPFLELAEPEQETSVQLADRFHREFFKASQHTRKHVIHRSN
jgi:hypothetical protein